MGIEVVVDVVESESEWESWGSWVWARCWSLRCSLDRTLILNRRRAVIASISTSSMVGFGTNFWLVPVTNCCTSSSRERWYGWLDAESVTLSIVPWQSGEGFDLNR